MTYRHMHSYRIDMSVFGFKIKSIDLTVVGSVNIGISHMLCKQWWLSNSKQKVDMYL